MIFNLITTHKLLSKLIAQSSLTRQLATIRSLHPNDIDYFKSFLGSNRIKQTDLEKYNRDWIGIHEGNSKLTLIPTSTNDVSKILSYCNNNGLQIVVQGGNTNVVAGSVPNNDEIILSMESFNQIIDFNETTGVLTCQPGLILESAESFVNSKGFMMPYDLGAKGSCQIGGNIASNAGGIRYIRYGSLHGSILGLETVLPNGTVLDMMSTLRKDNTGYDLKQLFIGSEGTLGVITGASILCPVAPIDKIVAFLGVPHFQASVDLLKAVKTRFISYLSAYELMDSTTMDAVRTNLHLDCPFDSPFYVLFEISIYSGSNELSIRDNLTDFLDSMMTDTGLVNEAILSTDLTSYNKLWTLRERLIDGLKADGVCLSYDVSLEYQDYYRIVETMRDHLKEKSDLIRVSGAGHLGDNNLHLTITGKTFTVDEIKSLENFLHKWIGKHGGSVSAEHGLGMKKRDLIYYSKSHEIVDKMKQLKIMLDPNNILNPKKVLPDN